MFVRLLMKEREKTLDLASSVSTVQQSSVAVPDIGAMETGLQDVLFVSSKC